MSPEDYETWQGKPTKDLNKKCKDNHKLLEGAVKKAGDMGEALGGNSTSFDTNLHGQAVKKFQQISNEILTLLDIMLERKVKVGNDLIVVGNQVVDETLAGNPEDPGRDYHGPGPDQGQNRDGKGQLRKNQASSRKDRKS